MDQPLITTPVCLPYAYLTSLSVMKSPRASLSVFSYEMDEILEAASHGLELRLGLTQ